LAGSSDAELWTRISLVQNSAESSPNIAGPHLIPVSCQSQCHPPLPSLHLLLAAAAAPATPITYAAAPPITVAAVPTRSPPSPSLPAPPLDIPIFSLTPSPSRSRRPQIKWRRISGRQAQGWSSTTSSTSRPATPHPVALPATASTPSRNSNRGLGLRYRIPSGELQYTPLISTTCCGGDGGSTPSPTSALVENYLICTVDCFSFTKYICSHASCFRYCSAHDVALCSHSEQVG
jgi:hypothetical protein